MKIIVDRNIRGAESTFGRHGDLILMDGREIGNGDLRDADLLIIRTATQVNQELLDGTKVSFVGTTSIGTDHLDIDWLEQAGIAWSNAPGCNADSAAQYTLAMAWLACDRLGRSLKGLRVGIIGRGNVGSRSHRLFAAMGAEVVANDPPLADAGQQNLVSQDEALDSDIVCLHTPLTRDGLYPSWRMIGQAQLARMPRGALLINTGRGDVIEGSALQAALERKQLHAALDVWPGEPLFEAELLEATTVATPHVAGYSNDGKTNGTRIVYEAFCRWAGIEPHTPGKRNDGLKKTVVAGYDGINQALDAACFVAFHDSALRRLASLTRSERAKGFDRLRRDYPSRRDFHGWTIDCPDRETLRLLAQLGFSTSRPV